MLNSLDNKVTTLLLKRKGKPTILPLRDPINTELFGVFRAAARSNYNYKQDMKVAQIKIA